MNGGPQDRIIQTLTAVVNLANAGRAGEALQLLASGQNGILQHPAGQNILGALLMQGGRLPDALKAFDLAVRMAPQFADAHSNRGVLLQRIGRLDDALAAYDAAVRAAPGHVTAQFNRGNVLKLLGRRDEAVQAFDAVLKVEPRLTDAMLNRARVNLERDAPDAALADFTAVLAVQPGNVDARAGQAGALIRLRRFSEAAKIVGPLYAEHPQHLEAGVMHTTLLIESEAYEDALAAVERMIGVHGRTPELLSARSIVLWKLDRRADALAAREEIVRLAPDDQLARESLAYLYLTLGDFPRGFAAYEARGRRLDKRQQASERAPRWNGEPIAGKRLLVLTEQGLGDTIQFIRYLRILVEQGAIVTAVVQPPILNIVRSVGLPVTWSDTIAVSGPFDYHIPLLSLPLVLGTTVDTVPADVPYLHPDPEKVAAWKQAITPDDFKVGVAWQGNPTNTSDLRRSVGLANYAPVAAVPGVRVISVQGVNGLDQLKALPAGMTVEELGEKITNNPDGISEVAAAMANLDLIVSSDTMTAHLAGATGRPVWVALTYDADWRWLKDRSDSPWYPTMRLFRQKTPGDWPGVFAEIAEAVRALVEQRNRG